MKSNSSVACWGNKEDGQTTLPAGCFVSVSAGWEHSCGVRGNCSVACWGDKTRALAASDFPDIPSNEPRPHAEEALGVGPGLSRHPKLKRLRRGQDGERAEVAHRLHGHLLELERGPG